MALKKRDRNYHMEGWINVKCSKTNNNYMNLYGQLKGQEIQLFTTELNATNGYVHHVVSLLNVQTVDKDGTRKPAFPTIVVKYRGGAASNDVRIRAKQKSLQDKWFSFIYTVSMLKTPPDTSFLLPGQVQELNDIVDLLSQGTYLDMNPISTNPPFDDKVPKGKLPFPPGSRRASAPVILKEPFAPQGPPLAPKPPSYKQGSSPTDRRPPISPISPTQPSRSPTSPRPQLPSWLIEDVIDRAEAEKILTENEQFGNLIIRRRTNNPNDIWLYAVSIKTGTLAKQYKHYQVQRKVDKGRATFLINLAGAKLPVLSTLEDIVKYFVEIDRKAYRPMKRNVSLTNNEYEAPAPSPTLYTLPESEEGAPLYLLPDESEAYENESFRQNYNNITGDVRTSDRRSATLPIAGRPRDVPPLVVPRQTSSPAFPIGRR